MNYEEMSDYEINKEVSKYWDVISKHLDLEDTEITFNDENETVYVIAENGVFEWLPVTYFDPCKNPNDAWPIIVDNGINLNRSSLQMDGYTWQAGKDFKTQSRDKNPLRAAMIYFLKMKVAEK